MYLLLTIQNDQLLLRITEDQKHGFKTEALVKETEELVGTFRAPKVPTNWNEEEWLTISYDVVDKQGEKLLLQGTTEDKIGCVWEVKDSFTIDNEEVCFQRTVTLVKGNRKKETVPFVYHIGFEVNSNQYPLVRENSYHMIPGISYNDNPFGEGNYPKNITKNENQYVFRADRLAIPGQTVTTQDYSIGFYHVGTQVQHGWHEDEQLSIGFECLNDTYELSFYYPEREFNHSYGKKGEWSEPYKKGICLEEGQSISSSFYFSAMKKQSRHDYSFFLWQMFQRCSNVYETKQALPLLDAYRKRVEGANQHFWHTEEERGWFGHRVNGLDQEPKMDIVDFRVGFIGRSLMMATETYRLAVEQGIDEWKEKIIRLVDWFCEQAPTKEGWFYPDYNGSNWFTSWKDKAISTRKQVEGIIQLIELYQLSASNGETHENWLRTAENSLTWLVKHGENGAYNRWFNFKGEAVDKLHTHTPYVMTALLKMYQLTKQSTYLTEAKKSWLWVVENIIEPEIYFGGTLDASTEDKEAAIITVEAGVMLYEATGNQRFLKDAKKAADQVVSYMMMHNVQFSQGTSLGEQGFKTFGTTLVSPEHNHIDPYTTAALVKLGVYSNDLKYAQAGVYNLQATTQDIQESNLQREIWYQGPWWYFDRLGKGNAQPWSVGWSQILAASVYQEVGGIFVSQRATSGIGIDGCQIDSIKGTDTEIFFTCRETIGQDHEVELCIPDFSWEQGTLCIDGKEVTCFPKHKWVHEKVRITLQANEKSQISIKK